MFLYAEAHDFFDGDGKLVAALSALDLTRKRAGPFLLYVPDVRVLGGSVGILGVLPAGIECGRLFDTTPKRCIAGFGDPYVEVAWSRFYGTMRPSLHPDAYPVAEGLAISFGLGVVVPVGKYDAADATTQGLTLGNNIWDFAPTAAFTYTTKPIIAEGTEISVKLYWNNYLTNPATQYSTGSLVDIDFAMTERIGRLQLGIAGFYAFQVADDKQFGVPIPPDGRRVETLSLGPVLAYDMPEHEASLKVKALTSIITENTVRSSGIAVGWIKRF